jgi:hypothetical protein
MARKPKIVRLKKGKIPDDTKFIETLVWVLDQARQGKIRGYAMAFVVDQEERIRTIESACSLPDNESRLQLLGTMRCTEVNFMKREKMGEFSED